MANEHIDSFNTIIAIMSALGGFSFFWSIYDYLKEQTGFPKLALEPRRHLKTPAKNQLKLLMLSYS
jgi:hypothetical protein